MSASIIAIVNQKGGVGRHHGSIDRAAELMLCGHNGLANGVVGLFCILLHRKRMIHDNILLIGISHSLMRRIRQETSAIFV